MLEFWYKEKRTLVDFRRAPLGPYFDGMAAKLKTEGYAASTAKVILGKCCLFNNFLIEQKVTRIADLSQPMADAFLAYHLADVRTTSRMYAPGADAHNAIKHLFAYLVTTGAWTPPKPKPTPKVYDWILKPYLQYLNDEHELCAVMMKSSQARVVAFLEMLGTNATRKGLLKLRADKIESHVRGHLKDSPDNYSAMAAALRRFLRYCADRKLIGADFSGLIPPSRRYRLASLPKGMEDPALDRVLRVFDRETPGGARDYAIAILMMAYGIRGISAAELLLDDIDWQHSRIRIRARKGGKEVMLPLLEAVGDVIIEYLKHRADTSPFREVFLSIHAPIKPLSSQMISQIIRSAMAKAGVLGSGGGSRTLRHSWAIRALGQNSSIKAIADVLGHRYIDTTFIYAKADLKALREVAMPWPEKG